MQRRLALDQGLIADRAFIGTGHHARVDLERRRYLSGPICRGLPGAGALIRGFSPTRERGVIYQHVDRPRGDIDFDWVTRLNQGNRTAGRGLG